MTMKIQSNHPLFISVEGVDGSGKTTQLKLFCAWLEDNDVSFTQTREPGGTEVGHAIRQVLLEGGGDKLDGISELLLFSADRHEHIRQRIRPALEQKLWVITDRFADSTTVFQSVGRGIDRQIVNSVHNLAVEDTWPDLTLILDIPYEEGLQRKKVQEESGLKETRMESLGADFHHKVRKGYHLIAKEHPERCRVIDARGTVEEVQARMREALMQFLKERETICL